MTDRQQRPSPHARSCCTESAYTHAWLMGLCASLDLARLEVLVETRSDDAGRFAYGGVTDAAPRTFEAAS